MRNVVVGCFVRVRDYSGNPFRFIVAERKKNEKIAAESPAAGNAQINQLLFKFRIPEVFFKIDDLVVYDLNAFVFEQLLHQIGSVKMVFSG